MSYSPPSTQALRGQSTPTAAKAHIPHYLSLLSGAVRLRILRHLANGPECVGSIASRLGVSIGLVSHNLRQLREAGLVTAVRRSRQRIYGLDGHLARPTQTGLSIRIDHGQGDQLTLEMPRLEPRATPAGIVQTHSSVTRTILARRREVSSSPDRDAP